MTGGIQAASEAALLERHVQQLRRGEVLSEAEVKRLCEKVGFSLRIA